MKSLMMKLMLIFGMMVLVVCAVFLVFSLRNTSANLSEVAEESLEAIRDAWSIGISDFIEAEQYLLETIARRTSLVDETLSMEQRVAELQADLLAGKEKGFLNFGLIQPNGTAYVTDGTIIDVSSEDYFNVAMTGKIFASDPFNSRFDSTRGDIVRAISVPILVNNKPVGALVLIIDGLELSNLVIELEKNIQGSGTLISMETGEFVAQLNPARVTQNILEEFKTDPSLKNYATVIQNIMRGETGTSVYSNADGEERLALY